MSLNSTLRPIKVPAETFPYICVLVFSANDIKWPHETPRQFFAKFVFFQKDRAKNSVNCRYLASSYKTDFMVKSAKELN